MALTITLSEIPGQDGAKQPVGQRYERLVTLNITGDASAVSGTMPNTRALGFKEVTQIFAMESLTESPPDEDEFYPLRFIRDTATGVWTVYVGDNHAGSPVAATAHTATIKLIGY